MLTSDNAQKGTNVAILNKSNNSTRDIIINNIINLAKVMNVKEIEGWDDISFGNIETIQSQDYLTTHELSVLLDLLENMAGEIRYQNYLEEHYLRR